MLRTCPRKIVQIILGEQQIARVRILLLVNLAGLFNALIKTCLLARHSMSLGQAAEGGIKSQPTRHGQAANLLQPKPTASENNLHSSSATRKVVCTIPLRAVAEREFEVDPSRKSHRTCSQYLNSLACQSPENKTIGRSGNQNFCSDRKTW